ncbi:hypothetical protein MPL3356_60551 [Mesorhizobium plurifarium]|uniref:Uncharacterized protein n=1 Tax=Mesorhizobium plurifarium TaxID=69974 RepID=A0A090EA11_MESPL|nr:hypothetical protein MPL3356_60551 [Mesorhizobium plurifarium]
MVRQAYSQPASAMGAKAVTVRFRAVATVEKIIAASSAILAAQVFEHEQAACPTPIVP